jgi:hypothetical protein
LSKSSLLDERACHGSRSPSNLLRANIFDNLMRFAEYTKFSASQKNEQFTNQLLGDKRLS